MGAAFDRWHSAFERRGSSPLIEFGRQTFTYDAVSRRAERYRAALADRGVSPGDRVAVLADPHPDVIAALVAHHRAGIVHVPINTRYRVEEVRHILTDSAPRLALAGEAHVETVRAAAPELAVEIIGSGGGLPVADRPADPSGQPDDEDPALMIYTSGTTAKSKGVVLSFGAVVGNMAALTGLWGWSGDDRLVLALPLFHVHGLCIGVHGAILHGMAIQLHPSFDPSAVAEGVAAGGTVFMGVPTMYRRLVEFLDERPAAAVALRGARLFTSGSAALSPDTFRRFEAHTGHRIVERYGMSETLITLSNRPDGPRRPGLVGRPVPGVEARIVGEDGRPAGVDEVGELEVRGVGLMTEYWGQPDTTRACFRSDGWFMTGDVARRDAQGDFAIVGRKSVDIIKTGGFKVSAREIEDVLRDHPAVSDAAVVGLTDETWGQSITAAVVLVDPTGGTEALRAELTTFAASRLADFKKPKRLEFVEDLPRNALGKIQKHRLIEALAGAGDMAAARIRP